MVDMQRVQSSMISQIGYDSDKQELIVDFRKGQHVVYEGVPSDVAAEVIDNPVSVGGALNDLVKPYYDFRYE